MVYEIDKELKNLSKPEIISGKFGNLSRFSSDSYDDIIFTGQMNTIYAINQSLKKCVAKFDFAFDGRVNELKIVKKTEGACLIVKSELNEITKNVIRFYNLNLSNHIAEKLDFKGVIC